MVRGDGRITYTRRHSYHTLSNKAKVVKTPGGKLVAHYNKKSAKGPRCSDCGIPLPGVSFDSPCADDRLPEYCGFYFPCRSWISRNQSPQRIDIVIWCCRCAARCAWLFFFAV